MSNEQSEVRVGDVWMFGGREETVYDIDGDQIVACKVGMKDGNFTHYGRGCCWRPRQSMSYGRLISRAESCKEPECKAPAWCGYRYGDHDDPRRALYHATNIIGTNHNDRIYCSPDCPNVPRSPLSAQGVSEEDLLRSQLDANKPAPPAKTGQRCAGGCGTVLTGTPRALCATCKPTLAAPTAKAAKHPERRPGQRYKDGIGYIYTLTRYDEQIERWYAHTAEVGEVPMPHDFSRLTLLSDAPAEGRACECGAFGTPATAHTRVVQCLNWANRKPAPAAKPVKALACDWRVRHECGSTFERHTSVGLLSFCRNGAVAHEQEIASLMRSKSTGTPCDQPPGLLPKPRMAHVANQDWDVGSEVE